MVQSNCTTLNATHRPSLPTESLKPVDPRLATSATSSAHLWGTQAAHRNAVFASSDGVSQRPSPQQTPSHGGIRRRFIRVRRLYPIPSRHHRNLRACIHLAHPGETAQKYISLLALTAGALAGLSLGGL